MATELISLAEAAQRLGLGQRTVRRLVREGRLHAVRPAGLRVVRVRAEDVDALASERSEAERGGACGEGGR